MPDRSTVLITGATGFIGSALTRRLRGDGRFGLCVASRRAYSPVDGIDSVVIDDLTDNNALSVALVGVHTVVHLAARVHVMQDRAADPLERFRAVNTAATQNLASQALRAGVKRLIFLSSVKVNGEETRPGRPFTERDEPAPSDPYAVSKYEAELALQKLAAKSEMNVVIIRPALVYGPGVKANFRRMMQWLDRGVPLPFGSVDNRRSLIGLDNLVDLIITCISHPAAANQTFLAADGEDLSTTDLLRRLAGALGRRPRLIPIPEAILRVGFASLNRGEVGQRLCGSLQVDISKARDLLGWKPPLSVDEGLRRTAAEFSGAA